jgi:hypothetical protein
MSEVELKDIPEPCELSLAKAREILGISWQELYERLEPGHPHELTWAFAVNPRGGPMRIRKVDSRTLTCGPKATP